MSRNPFSKVEIGTKFTVRGTAAFSINVINNEYRKEWHNSPLAAPIECYFVGVRKVYDGDIRSRYTAPDPNTGAMYRIPKSGVMFNRIAHHAAMFIPVNGVQYRAPMMALVGKCAMDGCDAPVIGHTCCPKCAEFLDPVETGKTKCRFCGGSAHRLADGTVQCGQCGRNDDEPGYHDDSGDFPEPSDFMLESLEMDYDAMYRIFKEVAQFDIGDVVESWGNDAQWKEAWEYGYLVGYEDLPYRPLKYTTKQEGPYDWDLRWNTPMHDGFGAGLWAGEADRKAGKPADWTIYIPF